MFRIIVGFFAIVVFFMGQSCELGSQTRSEYEQIVNKFEQWKSSQIRKGIYAAEKGCTFDTVTKEGYSGPTIGVPNDIDFSFTDINADNKLDAVVTFNPNQCDGGNALMNAQVRLLILSNGISYITDDTYVNKIESRFTEGWFNIEKASYGTVFGTYYQYKETDGRCCPSIRRPFTIDYKTKELKFTDK